MLRGENDSKQSDEFQAGYAVWREIFAIFSSIRKNKFPQIKITANIFFGKNLPQNEIFSNLNSLHKNTVLRNRVCSITICLFRSETKRNTINFWFKKNHQSAKTNSRKNFSKKFSTRYSAFVNVFFSQHHETSFQGSGQILNGGIFCL